MIFRWVLNVLEGKLSCLTSPLVTEVMITQDRAMVGGMVEAEQLMSGRT